jgi:hypothetical protein
MGGPIFTTVLVLGAAKAGWSPVGDQLGYF